MAHNNLRPGESLDEPDENTALCPTVQRQYETIVPSADRPNDDAGKEDNASASANNVQDHSAEREPLLLFARSAEEENLATSLLAPGPLKPVSPECVLGEEDRCEEDGGNENNVEADGADSEDGEHPSFLINTQPRRFHVLFAGIMLTFFLANFDSTIMASSHPTGMYNNLLCRL